MSRRLRGDDNYVNITEKMTVRDYLIGEEINGMI